MKYENETEFKNIIIQIHCKVVYLLNSKNSGFVRYKATKLLVQEFKILRTKNS